MRILTVLHDLSAGGTERVALTLAAAWRDAGADSSLLLGCARGPLSVPGGVEWREVAPHMPRSPLSRVRLWPGLASTVSALAPDVLFLPGNWHLPLAHGAAAARPRPLIVGKLSNPPIPRLPFPVRPFGRPVFRALAAPVDVFAAWPPQAAARLRRLVPRTEVVAIPNPPFAASPLVRTALPPSGRLFAAGRLVPQKDFALAIAAMSHLPDMSLDIAGDGPERPALLRQIDRLGLGDRVRILGHVETIAPLLAAADLLLLTSRYEGTPSVLMEALAAGLPVVATPCSDMVESLVTAESGELVARPTPARLARAIRRQLARPGPIARQSFAEHAPDHVAQRYLELFERLGAGR